MHIVTKENAPVPQKPNHLETGNTPNHPAKKLTLRRAGGAALGLAVAVGGFVGVANASGSESSESNRVATERVELEPLPPATTESAPEPATPERGEVHEQAQATVTDLSDRIMDLSDEFPDNSTLDTESIPGKAIMTVTVDATPTADGVEGNYALSAEFDWNGGEPDPRDATRVSISIYEKLSDPNGGPINRHSINLGVADEVTGDLSLTQLTQPVDGQPTHREFTTAPVQSMEGLDALTPESLDTASQEAIGILGMAGAQAPIR
jgi:hypothetical protein